LVAGGTDGSGNGNLASAELYDPASGSWTDTGSLNNGRSLHTATLLLNGDVLVAAGSDNHNDKSAEFYEPTTEKWYLTGGLNEFRIQHTATLLPNGQVLVAGG